MNDRTGPSKNVTEMTTRETMNIFLNRNAERTSDILQFVVGSEINMKGIEGKQGVVLCVDHLGMLHHISHVSLAVKFD